MIVQGLSRIGTVTVCRTTVWFIAGVLQLGLLIACGQPSTTATVSDAALLVPRSVASLNATGELQLDFSINGTQVYRGLWTPDFESALQVDANLTNEDVNEIVIIFAFRVSNNEQFTVLASAIHLLPAAPAGSTITLPAIVYRYEDSDNDGRYNVHELVQSNQDVDNDGLLNVNDPDSDNDGINDGLDPTPYGGLSNATDTAMQRPFTLNLPDGTSRTLLVDRIVGDPEEVNHLVDTLGQATLQNPEAWPTVIEADAELQNALGSDLSTAPLSAGWTAFSLGRRACPEWRLLLDASSINNSTTQPVLLYFRLADRDPQFTILGATTIGDLDVYDHTPPFDGNGPLNNSLRLILVPPSTLGWMNLWTERSLMGSVCSINLATD